MGRSRSPPHRRSPSSSPPRSRSKDKRRGKKPASPSRSHSRSLSRSRPRRDRSRDRDRGDRDRGDRDRMDRGRNYDRGRGRQHEPARPRVRERDQHGHPVTEPSTCLGVFGLSNRTREDDLRAIIERYAPVDKVIIIYDIKTGVSRRFGFCHFDKVEDAAKVREKMNGMEIHERNIRVDFSLTARPHSPTPGEYMGRKTDHSPPRRYYRNRSYSRSRSRGRR